MFALPAIVFAILAMVKKSPRKPLALTGLILAGLSLIISIVVFIISLVVGVGGAVNDAIEEENKESVAGVTTAPETDSDEGGTSAEDTTDEDVAVDGEVDITESAFYYDEDYGSWSYAVVLENPNADLAWLDLNVTIDAYGPDDIFLGRAEDYWLQVMPNSAAASTGIFYDVPEGDTVERIEVTLDGAPTDVSDSPTGYFEVSTPEYGEDVLGTTASGTVTSYFADDLESVVVTGIAYDANGEIFLTEIDYLDNVPGDGGTARYEVSFWEVLPEGSSVNIYVQP